MDIKLLIGAALAALLLPASLGAADNKALGQLKTVEKKSGEAKTAAQKGRLEEAKEKAKFEGTRTSTTTVKVPPASKPQPVAKQPTAAEVAKRENAAEKARQKGLKIKPPPPLK